MSTAAQDEFSRLVQNNTRSQRERAHDSDSASASDSASPPASPPSSNPTAMPSRTQTQAGTSYIPNTIYDANTGPKGVIADAQAFERARKSSFRKTLLSAAGFSSHSLSPPAAAPAAPAQRGRESPRIDGEDEGGDDDEDFMARWRESRMQELQASATGTGRKASPRRRVWGRVDDVDAGGYLDAIEKVAPGTVVVVCIYDPESNPSAIVEDCLDTLATTYPTTRFVKLHHEIAEMDHIQAPALLAYRDAEVFATLVDIFRLVRGGVCSAESLGDLLKAHRVL